MEEITSLEQIAKASATMWMLTGEYLTAFSRGTFPNSDFENAESVEVGRMAIDVDAEAHQSVFEEAMYAWVQFNKPQKYGPARLSGPRYDKEYEDPIQFLKDVSEKEPGGCKSIWQIMAHMKDLPDWGDKNRNIIVRGRVQERLLYGINEGIIEDVPNGAKTGKGETVPGYRYIIIKSEVV